MWELTVLGERVRNGSYELHLFVSYHETELECFEWVVKLKDKGNYYIKDIHVRDLQIEIAFSDNVKISEQTVNKAIMIATNYLLENMETDKQESAE